jgi:hypothetical protein
MCRMCQRQRTSRDGVRTPRMFCTGCCVPSKAGAAALPPPVFVPVPVAFAAVVGEGGVGRIRRAGDEVE